MKVAKRSPKRHPKTETARATLTLPAETYQLIDALRGNLARSTYVQQLVEREKASHERQAFVAAVNAACTPEMITETLRVHAEYPIHGEG